MLFATNLASLSLALYPLMLPNHLKDPWTQKDPITCGGDGICTVLHTFFVIGTWSHFFCWVFLISVLKSSTMLQVFTNLHSCFWSIVWSTLSSVHLEREHLGLESWLLDLRKITGMLRCVLLYIHHISFWYNRNIFVHWQLCTQEQ